MFLPPQGFGNLSDTRLSYKLYLTTLMFIHRYTRLFLWLFPAARYTILTLSFTMFRDTQQAKFLEKFMPSLYSSENYIIPITCIVQFSIWTRLQKRWNNLWQCAWAKNLRSVVFSIFVKKVFLALHRHLFRTQWKMSVCRIFKSGLNSIDKLFWLRIPHTVAHKVVCHTQLSPVVCALLNTLSL